MTPADATDFRERLVKVETEMLAEKEAKELKEKNDQEWREEAREDRRQILEAVNNHISDSAKVPGYQGNGGVIVISKKILVTAFFGLIGAIGTIVSFEFQIIGG